MIFSVKDILILPNKLASLSLRDLIYQVVAILILLESLAIPFQRKGNVEKQEEISFCGIL